MPSRAWSRRQFLAAAGVGAGGLALGGCGSALATGLGVGSADASSLTYWNLFSGGDGANMVEMTDGFRAKHPDVTVEATTLAWGNPYYTKLSLATAGDRAPDVAIVHLSRSPLLAQAGLLTDLSNVGIAGAGITEDRFTPAAWKKAQLDGVQYAVPLDTHVFVLYYNTDVASKAGLMEGDTLADVSGQDRFVEALTEMQKVTGEWGGVVNILNDPATNWRWFFTLYSQLGGQVVTDDGTEVALDDDMAATVLDFMHTLTTAKKLMPQSIDGGGVTSLFSTGKTGVLLDGNWQIPTYAETDVTYDVVPIPPILGEKARSVADSHALVIPVDDNRPAERTRNAVSFVRWLLDDSLTWAKGGHIPAWLPVQQGQAFKDLLPQAHYVQAAYDAVYPPQGWYTGSGSDFEVLMGSAVQTVQAGGSVSAAVTGMRKGLERYAATTPPIAGSGPK